MISHVDALGLIEAAARERSLSEERLPIENTVGRVTTSDVCSPIHVPPFDNSAMDGFAVDSAKTIDALPSRPFRFDVAGCIAAGDGPLKEIVPASTHSLAVEIMTGAPIPYRVGVNSIVKIEDVEIIRDKQDNVSSIWIKKPVAQGEHIRRHGQDIEKDSVIFSRLEVISPSHIMAMASAGISTIPVQRRVRVAILSTGKELVHHGHQNLEPGQIYNSTAPFLMSALAQYGALPQFYGMIPDDVSYFIGALERALSENPDIVISTGAVSVGKYDFVREALSQVGANIAFHKCAVRPGKPMLFADLSSMSQSAPVFFGIPGNPVPAAVALRFFVEPYLRALAGLTREQPVLARLLNTTPKPEGLRCFYKAHTEFCGNELVVSILPGQESFRVTPLIEANAWALLEDNRSHVTSGDLLEVFPSRSFHGIH